ncbi:MAG TPA: DUF732 domain-containing protein [Nocardia sp.]|nr:DUF732 domain-containing protein [Nocardia sp.]HLS78893.1 DUF732 domain-containing protein [Nocardia sp.]
MSIAVRTITSLLALGAAAAITAAPATAAPSTGSAGGSSSSGCGPRSNADYHFLAESYFDEEPCDVQDAAIQLAHSNCRWLDAAGNSLRNQIILAEMNRDAVDYPYTFTDAAISAYCPHHTL